VLGRVVLIVDVVVVEESCGAEGRVVVVVELSGMGRNVEGAMRKSRPSKVGRNRRDSWRAFIDKLLRSE
jgi:hypothetical protein